MKLAYALTGGFLIIALIIAGSSYYTATKSEEVLEKTIAEETQAITTNTIQDINRRLTMRVHLFRLLTFEEEFQNSLTESNKEFEIIPNRQEYINQIDREWLKSNEWYKIANTPLSKKLIEISLNSEKLYGFPIIAETIVTNKYGATIAITGRTTDYKQDDEEWWKQATHNGAYIEGISYDESAGIQVINIATKIVNTNGEFIGVIKSALHLQDVIKIIEETATTLPQKSTIKWVTSEGRIIYSSQPYTFMQLDIEGAHVKEEKVKYHITKDKLIAHTHSQVQNAQWSIVIETDLKTAFEDVTKLSNKLTIVSILTILLSLALGIIMTRKTIGPVNNITKAIDEISKGNFDVKVHKSNIDEIDELARSTNRILTTLKLAVKRVGIKKEEIIPMEKQKRLQDFLEVFKKNFENSPTSMMLVEFKNEKPTIVNVNKKFTEYYGYKEQEIKGKMPSILKSGKQNKKFYQEMWDALLEPKIGYWTAEVINKTKKGKLIKVMLTINTIFDEEEKPKYFIANHIQIP